MNIISNELLKIAREIEKTAADPQKEIKRQVEQQLDKIPDEQVKEDLNKLINAKVRTASMDWKTKLKNFFEYMKNHQLSFFTTNQIAALVVAIIIGYVSQNVEIPGINDPAQSVRTIYNVVAGLGLAIPAFLTYPVVRKLYQVITGKQLKQGWVEKVLKEKPREY